jgi:hypothetical protein
MQARRCHSRRRKESLSLRSGSPALRRLARTRTGASRPRKLAPVDINNEIVNAHNKIAVAPPAGNNLLQGFSRKIQDPST